jgi:hypothetical protein
MSSPDSMLTARAASHRVQGELSWLYVEGTGEGKREGGQLPNCLARAGRPWRSVQPRIGPAPLPRTQGRYSSSVGLDV